MATGRIRPSNCWRAASIADGTALTDLVSGAVYVVVNGYVTLDIGPFQTVVLEVGK
ncbi:MAG: hypothetical protein IPK52_17670 [Chloroflexi bacterium]|nr:hypothetical protein [Chloroflexota bacterium]